MHVLYMKKSEEKNIDSMNHFYVFVLQGGGWVGRGGGGGGGEGEKRLVFVSKKYRNLRKTPYMQFITNYESYHSLLRSQIK